MNDVFSLHFSFFFQAGENTLAHENKNLEKKIEGFEEETKTRTARRGRSERERERERERGTGRETKRLPPARLNAFVYIIDARCALSVTDGYNTDVSGSKVRSM